MLLEHQLYRIFAGKFSYITGGQIDNDALEYLVKKVEEALLIKNVTQQLAKLGTMPTSENTTIAEQKKFVWDNKFPNLGFGRFLRFESCSQEKKWDNYISNKRDPWMRNFKSIIYCGGFKLFASYHTQRWKAQMKFKALHTQIWKEQMKFKALRKAFRKALRKVFAVMVLGDAVESFRKAFASSKTEECLCKKFMINHYFNNQPTFVKYCHLNK